MLLEKNVYILIQHVLPMVIGYWCKSYIMDSVLKDKNVAIGLIFLKFCLQSSDFFLF